MDSRVTLGRRTEVVDGRVVRYGLVLVVAWIALLKLTASEATRIQVYVSHSPFLGRLNHVLDPRRLAIVLGAVEFAAAVLIALGPWAPRVSVVGSALGILVFLSTLSFFVTTPGVGDAAAVGFPALSPVGQFLLKDVVLLGASIWTRGRSLTRTCPK